VIHHELRQRSDPRNRLLGRSFSSVGEASAAAVADRDEEEAVQRARDLFRDARWAVGDIQGDRRREPQAAHRHGK
jgi:hypothetical protein